MKRAIVITLICYCQIATAGPFEDCILQNMKGVQAQAAAGAINRACREKTTPKKCRDSALQKPSAWDAVGTPSYEYVRQIREQCLAECTSASYWSRTFGECSTD